jgi:DNA polymerase-3 subunit alpha
MIERYWGMYPFIFTTDSHYLKEDEREIHKAFLNSKSSKDREVDDFYRYAYMMGQDEVRLLMNYIPDDKFNAMVENSRRIKDMCKFYELEQKPKLATVEFEYWDEYEGDLDIFEEIIEEDYPNFYYYLHGDNKTNQYLTRLVAHGFNEKYQSTWDMDEYFSRLEEEFWTLREVGSKIGQSMADYFITMHKIIEICWNDAGTIVGPSRGSAGALLINFLLDITQMNPIEMDLPFVWRFLHPSRPDLPDVDFDTESDKRGRVFTEVKKYFNSIGGDVVNVCTFGTEGTKSAIKTAGRGLGIEDEVVSYITSMIPNERGFDWSLKECYYGDEEKERQPIKAFVEQMTLHPRLWELAQNIEGLVTRLGVHASGVVCVNDDFNNYNSYMKTSKGQIVTSYDLHTLERCGMVKYDFLTVSALDRIHQALNYMLEDGTIEWQGSLKRTYDKYLAPSVLDYDTEEMWRMASDGEIRSLFQFDTAVGSQSIKKIQPRSLKQLAIANSIMRLMADGEQPIDIYVKQKMVPQIWYDDMRRHGLTDEEIKVVEKYLKEKDGVAESQEVVMQLSMDPQISGFDMGEANKLRKTIAKKVFKDIDKVHELFNEKGRSLGTSQALLDYIWNVQFKMSFGYSFSSLHTTGYSLIALQEMNLAYHYPIIYWNTACLSVDASAINSQDFYNLLEDEIVDTDDDENKKTQNKMNYSKIATALDSFKNNCVVELPDINNSRLGFTPNKERNSILYGLKGITKITDPAINEIMMNRPFNSLDDFLNRVTKRVITKDKIINLIKCGAFDVIEHKNREEILKQYIWKVCEPKNKLTMQNANMLIDLHLLPKEFEFISDTYKLTKELRKNRDANRLWYCADRLDIPPAKLEAWRDVLRASNLTAKEIVIAGEPRKVLDSKAWDVFYEKTMSQLKTFISTHQKTLLERLNNRLFNMEYEKYCNGALQQWELDSMNFYFSGHPLSKVLPQLPYPTDRIEDIVEGMQEGQFVIKGKTIPRMKLFTIAGTVIDKDKVKGLVTLQTPSGVVNLKIYKDLFSTFIATIGDIDENGEKEIEQDSFFEKGTHLLVTGIQRGATFVPKVYTKTGRKSILKIVLDEDGDFVELEEKMDV